MAAAEAAAAAGPSKTTAFGKSLEFEVVEIENPKELNFILGHGEEGLVETLIHPCFKPWQSWQDLR
jgi:hypothetical protein